MFTEKKNDQEFAISSTVRVVANYSQDQVEMADGMAKSMGLGMETLKVARGYREYSTMDEHTTPIQNMVEIATPEHLPEHLKAYFKTHNLNYVLTDLKGFSQGEWHDVVIYDNGTSSPWSLEQLNNFAEFVDALFAGEVYDVYVQNAKTYTADDGSTITQWETDEDFELITVPEKLFALNADFISSHYGLEVVPEVQG
jgi:hypothetical protein